MCTWGEADASSRSCSRDGSSSSAMTTVRVIAGWTPDVRQIAQSHLEAANTLTLTELAPGRLRRCDRHFAGDVGGGDLEGIGRDGGLGLGPAADRAGERQCGEDKH